MAKGDSNKVQNQIDQQGGTAQNTLTNQIQNNTNQTGQFQSLYAPAAAENVSNYNSGQAAYDNFLKNQPNSAALYGQFLGGNYAGATQTGPASATPPASTTPASTDPVDQLLAKYNAKDTGAGSGVT